LGVAALVWRAVTAGRVTVTSLVLLAFAGGLAAWGRRLAFALEEVLEVDLGHRTYVLISDGRRAAAAPLDELGPLVASMRTRRTGLGDSARTVTEYVVKPRAHSKLDLYVAGTAGEARRRMEGLARAWRLPCQSVDGAVRAAEDLDKPLPERLRGSVDAAQPTPLRPEWPLRIEELKPGYALVSTHRSWAPLAEGWTLFVAPLGVLGVARFSGLRTTLQEMGGDALGRVLAGLMGVVLLALLVKLGRGARDTFFPGAVRVTPDGVFYRGSRIAFAEIEEITGGIPIEIVGDRRIVRLAESFCPPEATGAVARELQRLILAVAPTAAR
jgi:hypothetical protein